MDTMTVGELKAYLDEFPDSQKVGFAYPSGDYWKTELIGSILGVEYAFVKFSGYHQKHQLVKDITEEAEDTCEKILILG